MTRTVWVLNGPNLGRLGSREPDVYGAASYDELVTRCTSSGEELGLGVEVRQTDDETTYLTWLHDAADGGVDGLLLNPAAWTHTSVAVRDAVAQLPVPFVEVHLSNPMAREQFRHTSLTAGLALGLVAGFGVQSYVLALTALATSLPHG